MDSLYQALEAYAHSDTYPFHMPGHKRHMETDPLQKAFEIDITEVEGFDNLHHAEGILMEAMQRAKVLYGSEETHFLVNGSTGGILSALSALVSKRGKLLFAANSHKSAYQALCLRELEPVFLYPKIEKTFCLCGGIATKDVEEALEENSGIEAVFLTSPTYEGMVSDIDAIAEAAHKKGIPLIVDEAHGAHFGFHPSFPKSSVLRNADIVIHSLHKTLPTMTQSALLHMNGQLADRKKVREFLSVYQTSSPSYLLMAGIDSCIAMLKEDGYMRLEHLKKRISSFQEACGALKKIRIMNQSVIGHANIQDKDIGKLIISVRDTSMNGRQLYDLLLRKYGLQMEMAAADYVIAIATIMDTQEGFTRLKEALLEIDAGLKENREKRTALDSKAYANLMMHAKPVVLPAKAWEGRQEEICVRDAVGRISSEFVFLYPPGVPLLIPGEVITEFHRAYIHDYKSFGFALQGLADYTGEHIFVIKE